MSLSFDETTKNTIAEALAGLTEGATLEVLDAGGGVLASAAIPADHFAAASGGAARGTGLSVPISASGEAATYRVTAPSGAVRTGSVGTADADLVVSTTTFVSGETLTISAWDIVGSETASVTVGSGGPAAPAIRPVFLSNTDSRLYEIVDGVKQLWGPNLPAVTGATNWNGMSLSANGDRVIGHREGDTANSDFIFRRALRTDSAWTADVHVANDYNLRPELSADGLVIFYGDATGGRVFQTTWAAGGQGAVHAQAAFSGVPLGIARIPETNGIVIAANGGNDQVTALFSPSPSDVGYDVVRDVSTHLSGKSLRLGDVDVRAKKAFFSVGGGTTPSQIYVFDMALTGGTVDEPLPTTPSVLIDGLQPYNLFRFRLLPDQRQIVVCDGESFLVYDYDGVLVETLWTSPTADDIEMCDFWFDYA